LITWAWISPEETFISGWQLWFWRFDADFSIAFHRKIPVFQQICCSSCLFQDMRWAKAKNL
jgi:hypothetical protein